MAGQTNSEALSFNTESAWVMMINSVDLNIMFLRVANVLASPTGEPFILKIRTLSYD